MITNLPSQYRRWALFLILAFLILDALFFGITSHYLFGLDKGKKVALPQGRTHLYSRLSGRPKTHLNIAIVTRYSSDNHGQELRRGTWLNKKKYAKAHGYDIYDCEFNSKLKAKIDAVKGIMKNSYYFKYIALQEVLAGGDATNHKKYDWVVWQDPDSIFLNYGKRFEDVIDERFDVIVTTGPPDNPTWKDIVDSGSFLVKNSGFGSTFLEDVLRMSQNHCGDFVIEYPAAGNALNEWLHVCNGDGGYWLSDQGILIALYMYKPERYRCHFKKTWFRAFSSRFPWYGPGDFVVHFPGHSVEDRRKLIKAFSKFTNFHNGVVELKYTDLLYSEDSITSDLVELEELYKESNPTCPTQ